MIIAPAIDIRGGRCVRLVQGDYDRETVFGDDPAAMARRWIKEGGRVLHLVDLDGAKSGRSDNRVAVEAILEAVGSVAKDLGSAVTTELGGGIRDADAASRWLDAGVDRVIFGTAALARPEVVEEASKRHPGRVWVGIDSRSGKVAVSGWTQVTDKDAEEMAREMRERGAAGIIYTDIDRDGTGKGVNVASTVRMAEAVDIPVFASGGVHSVEDVRRLKAGGMIAGVIVGRALYEGDVTLADLLTAAS
jgi:phosphoribosylformimino-5-aminoimidazole carboxamide ribotide isomerase